MNWIWLLFLVGIALGVGFLFKLFERSPSDEEEVDEVEPYSQEWHARAEKQVAEHIAFWDQRAEEEERRMNKAIERARQEVRRRQMDGGY